MINNEDTDGKSCLKLLIFFGIMAIFYVGLDCINTLPEVQNILEFLNTVLTKICAGIFALILLVYIIFGLFMFIVSLRNQCFRKLSKEYPILVQAGIMISQESDFTDNLWKGYSNKLPPRFLANLIITNFGVWIRIKSTYPRISPPNDLISQNHFYNSWNNSVIPLDCLQLYYLLFHKEGSCEVELSPSDFPGFTHSTPKLQDGNSLKIILTFSSTRKRSEIDRVIQLRNPLMLKIIVLDEVGNYDRVATSNLYTEIYERKEAHEREDDDYEDDDESWMYKSRPMYW